MNLKQLIRALKGWVIALLLVMLIGGMLDIIRPNEKNGLIMFNVGFVLCLAGFMAGFSQKEK